MAAGTAAALVPIRSITRRISPEAPNSFSKQAKDKSRVSAIETEETVTYIPSGTEEAGKLCLKLLTKLQGIQLGREKDEFGWCYTVTKEHGTTVTGGL